MIVGVLLDHDVAGDEQRRTERIVGLDDWLGPKRAQEPCIAGAYPGPEHLERMAGGGSKYRCCVVVERDGRGRHVRDVGMVVFDARTRMVRMFEPDTDADAVAVSDAFWDCLCKIDGTDPPDPAPWGQVPPEWENDERWAPYRERMSAAFGGRWWPDERGFFQWRRVGTAG